MQVHAVVQAGSGATTSLIGTDTYGSFTLTSGTGAGPSQIAVALYFDDLAIRSKYVNVELTAINAAAQSSGAVTALELNGGSSASIGFDIVMTGTIADSTVYQFAYRVW